MLDEKVKELINKQINQEFYSEYLYLAFANYFYDNGLDGFQDSFDAVKVVLRFGNGREGNAFTVVVQIGPHEHGVVPFFLSLNFIPVGKAVKPDFLEIV